MRTILILLCVSSYGGAVAVAQERQPDSLYVSGAGLSSPSLSGGSGEAEWVHGVSPRTSVTLGGASTWVGNLWWAYGTVAGSHRRAHVMLSGRVSLGSGRGPEGSFPYGQYVGTLIIPLSHRVFVEGEGHYARVSNAGIGLVRLGGIFSASPRLSFRGGYYRGLSMALTQSVLGRADLLVGRGSVFGGVMTTFVGAAPEEVQTIHLATQVSRAVFAGAAIPTGRTQLIWAVHMVPQPGGMFSRVTATLRVPLTSPTPSLETHDDSHR